MDGPQFDNLTRTYLRSTHRRRVLKGLGGGLTAGLLGLCVVKPALAIPKHDKTLEQLDEKCVKEFGFPAFVTWSPSSTSSGIPVRARTGCVPARCSIPASTIPIPPRPAGDPMGKGRCSFGRRPSEWSYRRLTAVRASFTAGAAAAQN
jgi:hypothetical protein